MLNTMYVDIEQIIQRLVDDISEVNVNVSL